MMRCSTQQCNWVAVSPTGPVGDLPLTHTPVAVVAQDPRVGDVAFATQVVKGVTPVWLALQVPAQDWPTAMLAHVAGQGWELEIWGVVGRPAQSASHSQSNAWGQSHAFGCQDRQA
jgi:hypothetical protein